jgi:F-type H+-transporting ATPase subunit c
MFTKNRVLTVLAFAGLMISSLAFAQEGGAHAASASKDSFALLGAAIGIAIAAFGGAMGQGKAAAAALEGIARNPAAADKIFTPMLLGLALIESLVLLAWLVAFIKI